jgi:hypothetical protein
MPSFPLGVTPPDRFFYALGRVSFEAEKVSSHIDILLQVLTQVQDMSILSLLIDGDPITWKIDKCMRLLEVSSVFEARNKEELRRILGNLKGLFVHRNRYIHSTWERYDEKSGKAYATHVQRTRTKDVIVDIKQIEKLVDSFTEENSMLLSIIEMPFYDLIQIH